MALYLLPNECEALLSYGSNLVAEEMRFGLGWNSTSTTVDYTGHDIFKAGILLLLLLLWGRKVRIPVRKER